MMFVTGPMYSGQQEYVMERMGWSREELERRCALEVQRLAPGTQDLEALADELAAYPVVVACEMGGGVVPVDPEERRTREAAGRLACLLAQRADTVVRLVCGLPQILKQPHGD